MRFVEVVRQLSAQILLAAQTHMDEVNRQVEWRRDGIEAGQGSAPTIGSTEPIKLWAQELRLTAREPTTADAANQMYGATVWLDGFAFVDQRDRRPDGSVILLDNDRMDDFQRRMDNWVQVRRKFVNAVRVELGAEPFDHG